MIIIQRHSHGLHFTFTGKASRGWTHNLRARQLRELCVEDPDGVNVSTCKQRLHRPVEPDARLQVIQILRVVTDLNDARLVDTGNASIFEMLIVNLSPLSLLNDLILLAGQQWPKNVRLRLFQG